MKACKLSLGCGNLEDREKRKLQKTADEIGKSSFGLAFMMGTRLNLSLIDLKSRKKIAIKRKKTYDYIYLFVSSLVNNNKVLAIQISLKMTVFRLLDKVHFFLFILNHYTKPCNRRY